MHLELRRRDLRALLQLAREGRLVDGELHGHRGLLHADGRQRPRVLQVHHGVADEHLRRLPRRSDAGLRPR